MLTFINNYLHFLVSGIGLTLVLYANHLHKTSTKGYSHEWEGDIYKFKSDNLIFCLGFVMIISPKLIIEIIKISILFFVKSSLFLF